MHTLPAAYALENKVWLCSQDSELATIAVGQSQIKNTLLKQELEFYLGKEVCMVAWDEEKLETTIQHHFGNGNKSANSEKNFVAVDFSQLQQLQGRALEVGGDVIIQAVNQLISNAISLGASDVHLESFGDRLRLRYRIDGRLCEQQNFDRDWQQAIVSRLKIMAGLDIAEKRRPQDGRIQMQGEKGKVDLRLSTMPTHFGEKVVLRILDRGSLPLSLKGLGLTKNQQQKLLKTLRLPYGMVLVTGPTGSGKTTTLYAALSEINQPDRNVLTIEDPIEYHLNGINQTAIKPDIGLSFSALLRTVLRQDPDVIMVGEIRDAETAEIAVRAALTGHLVLSTLHTNDAISALVRLMDMGIEPFLVAGSLKMVMAQRLVRRICPECKVVSPFNPDLISLYQLPDRLIGQKTFSGKGCQHCNGTGYRGRIAVVEQFSISKTIAEAMLNKVPVGKLYHLAREEQMVTLQERSMELVHSGETTLEESIRETWLF